MIRQRSFLLFLLPSLAIGCGGDRDADRDGMVSKGRYAELTTECCLPGRVPVFVWAAGEPLPSESRAVSVREEAGEVVLSRIAPMESAGAQTDGASFYLRDDQEVRIAGKTISVQMFVRGEAGDTLRVAYSTAGAGNSGWSDYSLSGEWQWVEFGYDVRGPADGRGDFLGILPAMGTEVSLRKVRLFVEG